MGFHDLEILQNTCEEIGESHSHEMQARCQQVAAELRIIGDALDRSYFQDTSSNSRRRFFIGAVMLGIAIKIAVHYFARIFARNTD